MGPTESICDEPNPKTPGKILLRRAIDLDGENPGVSIGELCENGLEHNAFFVDEPKVGIID